MNGFSILMIVFGVLIFLAGLYLYSGHKSELLLWKNHNVKEMPMSDVKKVGKWTMIASLVPIIIALFVYLFNID